VQALTNALFDLAAYPHHIAPMREEAERVVTSQGWTKAALGDMHKIDSFLRESLRLNTGPGVLTQPPETGCQTHPDVVL
jgi:hypothetical protein